MRCLRESAGGRCCRSIPQKTDVTIRIVTHLLCVHWQAPATLCPICIVFARKSQPSLRFGYDGLRAAGVALFPTCP
jgi:hypothetical protein